MFRKTFIAFLVAVFSCASLSAQILLQGQGATFDERLGEDDGAAAAILVSGNERGSLELCDCALPVGGLARRVGYLEGFKKKFKETPVLQVEAGNLFYNSDGYTSPIMLQNLQVARAYSRWPADVINLSRQDVVYAQRLLAREGLAERSAQLPMIKNMVSANGAFGESVSAPASYVIKEVSGPRIFGKGARLRVGFVGLAEPRQASEGMRDAVVTDPFQAARFLVPGLRKRCDVLVIVAHAEMGTAMKLAEQNPEADVVVAGNADGIYKPRQVGSTLVVGLTPGNSQQGDLRIYLDKEGRPSYKFRSITLDSVIPSDPAAVAFAEEARKERERAQFHQ